MTSSSGSRLTFLIVGTPRSGTTLVQRIVTQLDGVAVPPETHFFSRFLLREPHRYQVPPPGRERRALLDRYAAHGWVTLGDERLDDLARSTITSPAGVFSAIVDAAAPAAPLLGEKTPAHLVYWRYLTQAIPHLKVVFVVRDPRAVVSSLKAAPWTDADTTASLSARWCLDQRLTLAGLSELPPSRRLLLRFEDVLADEPRCLDTLGTFLGRPSRDGDAAEPPMFLPGETWKERALEPVDARRADAWTEELPRADRRIIDSVCGHLGRRFGYATESAPVPRIAVADLSPVAKTLTSRLRSVRFSRGLARRLRTTGEGTG